MSAVLVPAHVGRPDAPGRAASGEGFAIGTGPRGISAASHSRAGWAEAGAGRWRCSVARAVCAAPREGRAPGAGPGVAPAPRRAFVVPAGSVGASAAPPAGAPSRPIAVRMAAAGYEPTVVKNPDGPFRKRIYFVEPAGFEFEFVEYTSDVSSERNEYSAPEPFVAEAAS